MSKTKKCKPEKKKSVLCNQCTGLCCRYFALPIDTPKTWKDFDDVRWYLSHENTEVFVEKGDWYLNVLNPCRHLAADYSCANYALRPGICRGYKTRDCEKTGDDYGYQHHFKSDKQLEDYMKLKFGPKVFEKYDKAKKKKCLRRKAG